MKFELGLSNQNRMNFLKHLAVVALAGAALSVAKELGFDLDEKTILTFVATSPFLKLAYEFLTKA